MTVLSELATLPAPYVVVFFLCIVYAAAIIRILCARDAQFRKAYYKIWCVTGVAGILTVLTQIAIRNHVYLSTESLYYSAFKLVNSVAATMVALGKVLGLINMYLIIQASVKMQIAPDWSNMRILVITVCMIVASTLISFEFFVSTLKYDKTNTTILELSSNFSMYSRISGTTVYGGFITVCAILAFLCRKQLKELMLKSTSSSTKSAVSSRERQLVAVAIFDCIAFGLKCIQQIAYLIAVTKEDTNASNVIASVYVYINGAATFTAMFLLFTMSSSARKLLLPKRAWSALGQSSVAPVTSIVKSRQ